MKFFLSFSSTKLRRALLVYHSLSVILPLLIVIFIVFQYVLPYLHTEQIEHLQHIFLYGLLLICLITVLGFFFLSVWIKSIEDLTVDAKSKLAGFMPEKVELEEENEVVILEKLIANVQNELQEKVDQINAYSQKLLESNLKLSELSITDELTTLYNRRYFDLRLGEEVRRQQRYRHNTALILVDVDGFKQYNDLNGHLAGDELLKDLAQLIRMYIRTTDIPSRYGGDEFAIICPECDYKEAKLIAERLANAFEARRYTYVKEKLTETVTISCGIAVNGKNAEAFVSQADKSLYEAKNSKKDR